MKRVVLLAVAAAFLLPSSALAHSGLSFEKASGAFFLDLGYDLPLQAYHESLFDLQLYALKNGKTGAPAKFDDVLLTLSSGAVLQFRESVEKPEFGVALLPMVPTDSGHWNLDAEFRVGDSILTKASFPVFVLEKEANDGEALQTTFLTNSVFLGLGVGLLVLAFFSFRRSS